MSNQVVIRALRAEDWDDVDRLYPRAFPAEDLLPLLERLRSESTGVLFFVAEIDDEVIGHICFTMCSMEKGGSDLALLGPLAVDPAAQHAGIGSSLVRYGLARLAERQVERVFVLGDPAYYGRFGFQRDTDAAAPYTLPPDWASAWQSLALRSDAPRHAGRLSVPVPWRDETLWAP